VVPDGFLYRSLANTPEVDFFLATTASTAGRPGLELNCNPILTVTWHQRLVTPLRINPALWFGAEDPTGSEISQNNYHSKIN
jgi:hypothetical protein